MLMLIIYILISNLTETRNNSKYLIGYLNEFIRPLVLMFSEMSGYVKTFKEKNNKLMSLHITDEKKLLEKYKTIWTKIVDLRNIELNVLPVHDDRYITTKIRTYGDKGYPNVGGLKVPEDGVECESVDSLLV